jgi:hypothetical protein
VARWRRHRGCANAYDSRLSIKFLRSRVQGSGFWIKSEGFRI